MYVYVKLYLMIALSTGPQGGSLAQEKDMTMLKHSLVSHAVNIAYKPCCDISIFK
jgi:hypothetical protein